MKATIYTSDDGKKYEEQEIPAEMKAQADEYREKMIEAIADFDEAIMLKFLEGESITEEELKAAIRKGTIENKLIPVLGGSSFKNKGVQALLDAVADYMPSPLDVGAVKGIEPDTEEDLERKPSDDEPFSALLFKIMSDKYVGRLSFIRVYSGVLKKGSAVSVCYRDPHTNEMRARSERIGRILQMHANSREDVDEVRTGEIVGVIGINDASTGYTICDPQNKAALESIMFPEPVIQIAVEPKSRADQEKLGKSLVRLAQEDPTFRVRSDAESGQTML